MMAEREQDHEDELIGADALHDEDFAADGDPEGPQECDLRGSEDDAPEDTIECPNCGRPVWEQAQRCSQCGEWIAEGHAAERRSVWFVVAAVVIVMIVFIWILTRR